MMNIDYVVIFVLVSIFFLQPGKIINEGGCEDIQNWTDLYIWRSDVWCQIYFLVAEGLVYLGNLIGVVINISHDVLI